MALIGQFEGVTKSLIGQIYRLGDPCAGHKVQVIYYMEARQVIFWHFKNAVRGMQKKYELC